MKRKDYEKPAMQIVQLGRHEMLLQSGGDSQQNVGSTTSIDNWNDGGTTNEDIYL